MVTFSDFSFPFSFPTDLLDPHAAKPTQPSILPRLVMSTGSSTMRVAPIDHHWCHD